MIVSGVRLVSGFGSDPWTPQSAMQFAAFSGPLQIWSPHIPPPVDWVVGTGALHADSSKKIIRKGINFDFTEFLLGRPI